MAKKTSVIDFTDKQGYTALILAAKLGNLELCESYIKAGADLNKQNHKGETALMVAAKEGHLDIVSELIKAGANMDIRGRHTPNFDGTWIWDPPYLFGHLKCSPKTFRSLAISNGK